MTRDEDFLGGLHFDGTARDVQVGPMTGIVRYYPVAPESVAHTRRSAWWHALGALAGAAGVALAAFVWNYGLAGMLGAGVLAGVAVLAGRAASLAAGLCCLALLAGAVLAGAVPHWGQAFAATPAALLTSLFLLGACWRPSS